MSSRGKYIPGTNSEREEKLFVKFTVRLEKGKYLSAEENLVGLSLAWRGKIIKFVDVDELVVMWTEVGLE